MNRHRTFILMAATAVYVAAVAVTDFFTPLVLDVWVLYLPAILAPVFLNRSRQTVITAVGCTLLMGADAFLVAHPKTPWEFVWGNLLMGMIALWLTAFVGLTIIRQARQSAEASRSLMESEERLRFAMQCAGMGTWDRDLRTNRTVWSDTHFRMLGYLPSPSGEASVEMWQSLLHPDDRERVLEAQEEARRNRALFSANYRVIRADNGKTAWLSVVGRFLYNQSGEAVRCLGVSFDITQRQQLEREVLTISDAERTRISHELHDSVGQELTGMGLMANALAQSLPETASEQRIVARLTALLDRIRLKVRNLSRGLEPVQVETKGLWAALDDLVTRTKQQSGIQVRLDCPESIQEVEHETAIQLFRIAQEALSNALRHGHPQHISVTLQRSHKRLCLRIQDDGGGCPPEKLQNGDGMGIHIMRYRAQQIGASLNVGPAEGGGTVVTCTLSNTNGPQRTHAESPTNGREKS